MQPEAVTVGKVAGLLMLGRREHHAVDGVLQAEQLGAGEVAVVGFHGCFGRFEIQHSRLVGGHRLGLDAAQHRSAAALVHVGVGVVAHDVLVAPLAVGQQAAQVRLSAAGHVQRRGLAEQLGGVALQLVDRGIVAPDVIADFGCSHGGAHLRRWLGDSV